MFLDRRHSNSTIYRQVYTVPCYECQILIQYVPQGGQKSHTVPQGGQVSYRNKQTCFCLDQLVPKFHNNLHTMQSTSLEDIEA